ncbi:hypothetical protein HGM15179_012282, partial [Zosterops borbonicus]
LLQEEAGKIGIAQAGEKKALGKDGERLLTSAWTDRTRRNGFKVSESAGITQGSYSRAALGLLPQGTAGTFTYSSRPLYCRIHLAKGRHCAKENVNHQSIKAADYHPKADTMAAMIAADKATEWWIGDGKSEILTISSKWICKVHILHVNDNKSPFDLQNQWLRSKGATCIISPGVKYRFCFVVLFKQTVDHKYRKRSDAFICQQN